MKAERRHELKTNALALALSRLPEMWRTYGTRVLVGLLVVVGGFLLIQQWTTARRDTARGIADNLALSRTLVVQMPELDLRRFGAPPEQIATERRQHVQEAERALGIVLRNATDPAVRAEALVYRGDLYWHLANMPALPGEADQPELGVHADKSREELLNDAERDYLEVINRYPQQTFPVISARFGLAAIAENRRNWEQAETYYRQLFEQPAIPELYRQQAEMRLEMLEIISQPVYIGQPMALQEMELQLDELGIAPQPDELEAQADPELQPADDPAPATSGLETD